MYILVPYHTFTHNIIHLFYLRNDYKRSLLLDHRLNNGFAFLIASKHKQLRECLRCL